jgi:ethanolamine ammonia-lyase small subunit
MTSLSDPPDRNKMRAYTTARVGLRRAGSSLATSELLDMALCHAEARDAVHAKLSAVSLRAQLAERGLQIFSVTSGARDRAEYLRRPDLGRQLSQASRMLLEQVDLAPYSASERLAIILADGLSAIAVERHALPVIDSLLPLLGEEWQIGPMVIAEQARVAIGDEIGETLRAAVTLLLIGERPGLSSPDSMGAYITWAPRVERTDAERNCISNIRPEGLGYAQAAQRIAGYLNEARRRQLTGVALKEDSLQIEGYPPPLSD